MTKVFKNFILYHQNITSRSQYPAYFIASHKVRASFLNCVGHSMADIVVPIKEMYKNIYIILINIFKVPPPCVKKHCFVANGLNLNIFSNKKS